MGYLCFGFFNSFLNNGFLEKQLPLYRLFLLICLIFFFIEPSYANTGFVKKEVYQIKIYHFRDTTQERIIDNYLRAALLPALHKMEVSKVGVFKVIANDTATDKLLYVFIPLKSLDQLLKMEDKLASDAAYQEAGKEYIDALYKNPPYTRVESIILEAFPLAPKMQLPQLDSPLNERVYELRSYESATEKSNRNKVKMFNEGGEINLFKRLNFNAVFYARVISGNHIPNLMYMTSFENKVSRDAHWKEFGQDTEWKKLSALPEYQNNVSHIDIVFMRPAEYSDF
jgi:hypothetical protein